MGAESTFSDPLGSLAECLLSIELDFGRPLTLVEEKLFARAYFTMRDFDQSLQEVRAIVGMSRSELDAFAKRIEETGHGA